MENDSVTLQFTVSDRDMLRDTNQGVKHILEKLDPMHERIVELERLKEQATGAAWALKLLWAVVIAICGLFGWHIVTKP